MERLRHSRLKKGGERINTASSPVSPNTQVEHWRITFSRVVCVIVRGLFCQVTYQAARIAPPPLPCWLFDLVAAEWEVVQRGERVGGWVVGLGGSGGRWGFGGQVPPPLLTSCQTQTGVPTRFAETPEFLAAGLQFSS